MFQEKQILRMGWGFLQNLMVLQNLMLHVSHKKIGGNLFPCAGVINVFSSKVLLKSIFNI